MRRHFSEAKCSINFLLKSGIVCVIFFSILSTQVNPETWCFAEKFWLFSLSKNIALYRSPSMPAGEFSHTSSALGNPVRRTRTDWFLGAFLWTIFYFAPQAYSSQFIWVILAVLVQSSKRTRIFLKLFRHNWILYLLYVFCMFKK